MTDEDRYSNHRRGRTQAMLDEAIERARHGEKVLVLVSSQELASYFKHHVESLGPTEAIKLQIDFMSVQNVNALIGRQWNSFMIDHYAIEHGDITRLSTIFDYVRTRIVPAKR